MLRFVVAGMAVVILALAGATGFLAYENLSEDDGGGTTSAESEAPTLANTFACPSPTPCPDCPEPTPCPGETPCPSCPEPVTCPACICPACPESPVCPPPTVCPDCPKPSEENCRWLYPCPVCLNMECIEDLTDCEAELATWKYLADECTKLTEHMLCGQKCLVKWCECQPAVDACLDACPPGGIFVP